MGRTTRALGGHRNPSGRFREYGSANLPSYLADTSILRRSVTSMPLAANSANIVQTMVNIKAMANRVSFDTSDAYTVPLYIVDSRKIALSTVQFKNGDGSDKPIPPTMRSYLQYNVPIPPNILIPTGSDKSVEIYDIATNVYRGFWQLKPISSTQYTCEWGGYQVGTYASSTTPSTYSGQYAEGKVCAAGLLGSLMTISVDEIKAGRINHALSMLLPWAYDDYSWPAKGGDGNVSDPNYPMQGQWCRLNPNFSIDAQNYNPILRAVCHAVQTYGATVTDKVGTSFPGIYFSPESALVYKYRTGTTTNPWDSTIATYAPGFTASTVLQAFPADQLQFAPKDWGKPV